VAENGIVEKLNILTALSRPENLPWLSSSISLVDRYFELKWWIIGPEELRSSAAAHLGGVIPHAYLAHEPSVGGQMQKNCALDQIADGWCWILDDDNTANLAMFPVLASTLATEPWARAVVFSQCMKNGALRLVAAHENTKLCHIDAAQFVLRRDLIGDYRIPNHYCGDGEFIETIHTRNPEAFAYVPDPPLVYYNSLR
jgi:hypothetical protein